MLYSTTPPYPALASSGRPYSTPDPSDKVLNSLLGPAVSDSLTLMQKLASHQRTTHPTQPLQRCHLPMSIDPCMHASSVRVQRSDARLGPGGSPVARPWEFEKEAGCRVLYSRSLAHDGQCHCQMVGPLPLWASELLMNSFKHIVWAFTAVKRMPATRDWMLDCFPPFKDEIPNQSFLAVQCCFSARTLMGCDCGTVRCARPGFELI